MELNMNKVSLIEINDKALESSDQDQTVRMCRLILIYTLRKNKDMLANAKIMVKDIPSDILLSPWGPGGFFYCIE